MTIGLSLTLAAMSYVLPYQSSNDPADKGLVNTKRLSELRLTLAGESRANIANSVISQGPVEHLAFCLPVLRQLVCDVVVVRSQEQMLVVHAQRVVAFMKDMASVRDWADEQLISDSVCERTPKGTVSRTVRPALPKYAALRSCPANMLGEAERETLLTASALLAYAGAELPMSKGHPARDGVECETCSTQLAVTELRLIEVSHGLNCKPER